MARRRSRARVPVALLAVAILILGGIWLWYFVRPPQIRSGLAFTPARFADLPGWNADDPRPALAAFRRSCSVLSLLPAARALGVKAYAGTARDWGAVCAQLPPDTTGAQIARAYFEAHFTPVAVGADGLFTGYYEPELHASRNRHGRYTAPVYGLPDDLVTADLGLFHPELSGRHITARIVGHRLVPYPARADIDRSGVAAPVLLYADDPVGVFFLHIQGSGRAVLDDGHRLRLAYAGQNGRPYTPIGRTLIAEGALDRGHMSMQAIAAWLKAHPGQAARVMESDASYVFFRELPEGNASLGSPGSEGVPLTPGASIAVDSAIHPLGVPVFLATMAPDENTAKPEHVFDHLLVAQDTGGAIKGPARADIFWGFGAAAEAVAGRMKSSGRFYVLLPKDVAARLPSHIELADYSK